MGILYANIKSNFKSVVYDFMKYGGEQNCTNLNGTGEQAARL
jgi:hypothetical protein